MALDGWSWAYGLCAGLGIAGWHWWFIGALIAGCAWGWRKGSGES